MAGEAYLLFGRTEWPATLDMRTDADVTFLGGGLYERLGSDITVGDLDRDGTDDLIINAESGDGPDETRSACGETFVFRGKPSWPSVMDMLYERADLTLYGPEADDQCELASVGDLDGNGWPELAIACGDADGPGNARLNSGEAHFFEPRDAWPLDVDLLDQSQGIIYGVDERDSYAIGKNWRDVSGDGVEDFSASVGSPTVPRTVAGTRPRRPR